MLSFVSATPSRRGTAQPKKNKFGWEEARAKQAWGPHWSWLSWQRTSQQ